MRAKAAVLKKLSIAFSTRNRDYGKIISDRTQVATGCIIAESYILQTMRQAVRHLR